MTAAVARPKARIALIRIGGSALLLGVLVIVLPFDQLVAAIARVRLSVWIAALAMYLALHLIGVIKWRLMSNTAGAGLSFVQAVRCYYAGLFGNTFLPSIVGGDVVRAGLALKHVRSKAGLLLGSFIDRLLDICALIVVAGIGAFLLPTALDRQSSGILWVALGTMAAGVVGLVLAAKLVPIAKLSFRLRRRAVRVRQGLRAISRRPGPVAVVVVLGITLQALFVMLNAWLGDACGIRIPLLIWLFVSPLAKLSGILPVTQNGIGVREVAQVALFAPFGVPAVLAVAVGLVFETIILAGGLLSGLISFVVGLAITRTRTGNGSAAIVPAPHGIFAER